jgi:hypothetical protein
VETRELLRALAEVAENAGLELRVVGGAPLTEGGPAAESGVARLRDRVIVMLSRADPPERHVEVLAAALRDHAGPWLDAHFVAPAVRERVNPG